jgi:hypothetical protein
MFSLLFQEFFFFSIQELLRNTTRIFLCTEKKCPKLFHELDSVFFHESSNLYLNFLPVHYLRFQKTMYEVNKHFIFKPKKLGHFSSNPRFHYFHIHLCRVHQMLQFWCKLLRFKQLCLLVRKPSVLISRCTAKETARHVLMVRDSERREECVAGIAMENSITRVDGVNRRR